VLERKATVKPFPRVRVEDRVEVTRAFDKCTIVPDAKSRFIPIYKSKLVDRQWSQSDMVASELEGDSTLSLQQRIEDTGFMSVVVTPMGGDRVILHSTSGEDIWQVFNDALHFFGVLFSNIHKWSVTDVKYERGAWVRVYGVPAHAWNEDFFKLCVMNSGRFIRADECTVEKARLDFARILVSTTQLKIVNTTSEFSIDGHVYVIKLVEEWGCNLGEDAFLTEIENESLSDTLPQLNIDDGMEEVQGEWELDDLVDDLHKEWSKHDLKNEGKHPVREEAVTHVSKVLKKGNGTKQQAHFNTVLEPVLCPDDIKVASEQQGSKTQSALYPSWPSNMGPWSLDFLTQVPIQEGDIVFMAKQVDVAAQPPKLKGNRESLLVEQHSSKKRSVCNSKHSVGFLKRVARMPSADRKEILKILKKTKP